MDPNEKIKLDDITFDDVIAGDGVDTVALDDIEKPVEKPKEEVNPEPELEEEPIMEAPPEEPRKPQRSRRNSQRTQRPRKNAKNQRPNRPLDGGRRAPQPSEDEQPE